MLMDQPMKLQDAGLEDIDSDNVFSPAPYAHKLIQVFLFTFLCSDPESDMAPLILRHPSMRRKEAFAHI